MEILTDAIHRYAIERPHHLALAWVNQKNQIIKKISYQEASAIINQMSAFLSDTTSLQSGDRAALLFPTGIDFILTFLACLQMGIIPIPLKYPNNAKKFQQILPILNECEPYCIISSRPIDTSEICSIPWIKIPENYHSETFKKPQTFPEMAFLQFTSGSTSEPKGVMVSHENLIHNIQLIAFYLTQNHTDQIVASWLPHYHDMGLIGAYLANLYYGSSGYYMAPTSFMTNPNGFLQLISDTKATLIQCPNTAYEYMVSQWDNREIDLSSLMNVINAAEPIHVETLNKFYSTFTKVGLRKEALKPTYGLAEATLFVTQSNTEYWFAYEKNIACGLCPDVDIRIVNPHNLQECKEPVEGEIWLHSKSNALGYYKKEKLTADIFAAKIAGSEKNYLRTGDLGFIKQGQLYITGRLKEIIIINGINYYPHDIEYTVEQFEGIQPHGCAVFSWEVNSETKIIVMAEVKNEKNLPDLTTLFKYILQQHTIPLFDIVLCPAYSLPKTTSGKVKRITCKDFYKENKISIIKQLKNKMSINHFILDDPANNNKTLYELGVDSIAIAHLHSQFEKMINPKFVTELVVTRLYQMQQCEYMSIIHAKSSQEQDLAVSNWLKRIKNISPNFNKQIKQDAILRLTSNTTFKTCCIKAEIKHALLTGSTGFMGAYLLFYLFNMTDYQLYLLVRSPDEQTGLSRVLKNLDKYNLLSKCHIEELQKRLHIICGDLSKENFGLSQSAWNHLASVIDCIYHNGAITNYLTRYEDIKSTNVDGTRSIIELALTSRLKYLHYISTTLIFGWTPTKQLAEDKRNSGFKYVDFGYAESKWVAEQLIWQAQKLGVPIQIYRPAMVTASSDRKYTKEDIVARSLTYLLNHNIAIDIPNQISFMPVDEATAEIVALSLLDKPEHIVYHITADYANLPMICSYLTKKYNYQFNYLNFDQFNQHLKQNASSQDLVYPLINFFDTHHKKMDKMHNKRYCRKNYLAGLNKLKQPIQKYSFEETLDFIMQFLMDNQLVNVSS